MSYDLITTYYQMGLFTAADLDIFVLADYLTQAQEDEIKATRA